MATPGIPEEAGAGRDVAPAGALSVGGGRNAGDPYSSREAGNTLAGRGAACGERWGVRKGVPGAAQAAPRFIH